jgi:hypothetical protein
VMSNFPALDVAIGLIFVFFILAIICSGINEAFASAFRWRAQDLERGLWELLRDPDAPENATEALEKLKTHPLVTPMLNPRYKASAQPSPPLKSGRPKTSRKTDLPAYIPSRTFTSALLGIGQKAVMLTEGADLKHEMRKIDQSIAAIPSAPVREAMIALLHNSQGDAVAFRRNVEQWYDDQMERVSGWYRKRIQRVLWILAFVVAFTLNADALQMAKRLWVEPSVRESLVSQAETATTQPAESTEPSQALETLTVPLGWHFESARDDPQGFPIYQDPEMIWALLSKLIGLTLTAVAISFGAPFWFDTLSNFARLRSGGAPPPASDAIRTGEGEQTRAGEGAVLATALLEARGQNVEGQSTPPAAPAAPAAGSESEPSVETGPPAEGTGETNPPAEPESPDSGEITEPSATPDTPKTPNGSNPGDGQ